MITDADTMIENFVNDPDRELSDESKKKYTSTLNRWAIWLTVAGVSWPDARKVDVINFKRDLVEKGRSNLYINQHLSVLNLFYGYLNDAGLYPMNIAWKVKKLEGYKGFRRMILNLDQVKSLIKSIDLKSATGMRDYLIIKIMLTSGLRSCEVSRLNVEDLLVDKCRLMVRGKGKYTKTPVGISANVVTDIKRYLGKRINMKDKPIFLVWEKAHFYERMSSTYIGIMIKARMKKAGIDDKLISAHSLRHTYAVSLLRSGVSLFDVSALMRHSSMNMTRNYVRFIEDEVRMNQKYSDQLEKYYDSKQMELAFESNIKELYQTL